MQKLLSAVLISTVIIPILILYNMYNTADKRYFDEGMAESKLGNYRSAITLFDKAIEINPYVSRYYVGRGIAKFGLGQFDRALIDCDKAILLDPSNTSAYLARNLIHQTRNELLE